MRKLLKLLKLPKPPAQENKHRHREVHDFRKITKAALKIRDRPRQSLAGLRQVRRRSCLLQWAVWCPIVLPQNRPLG